MKAMASISPSVEVSGRARLEEPLDGEGGDRRSSTLQRKRAPPFKNSAAPGRPGDSTPSDKTSALLDGRGVPEEVRTPRDRWPQGTPPAGTTSTSENIFSVGDAVNTNSMPAGMKDSCRSRISSSRR